MRSPLLAAILTVSLVAAVAIGGGLLLRGIARRTPIDCLPDDTELLLQAPDPARLWRDLARARMTLSGAESLWQTAALLAESALRRAGFPASPAPSEIAAALASETLLAVVPGEGDEAAGLALILLLRQGSEEVATIARRYAHRALGEAAASAWSERTRRGVRYLALKPPLASGTVFVAGVKGAAVLTTSGATMRRILDVIEGRGATLRSSAPYIRARGRLGRRGDLFAYASGPWIRRILEPPLERALGPRASRLLGLNAIRGAALQVDLRGDLFHERLFVALAPEGRGLAGKVFDAAPRPPRAGRFVPAGFPYYVAASWSGLGAAYRRLPEILAGASAEDRERLRARLEGLERFVALDLDRELFGALGDEMAIGFGGASPYPRGAPNRTLFTTPAVAAIAVRRQSAMASILARLDGLARATESYAAVVRDGQSMTTYAVPALSPLLPSYRLIQGHLLAATSPDLLARALDDATRQRTVAERPEVAAALEALPARAHLVLWADTGRLLDTLDLGRRAGDLPWGLREWLPASLRLLAGRSDLPLTAASARLKETGLAVDSISPVSPSLMVSMLAAGILAQGEPRGVEAVSGTEGGATQETRTSIPY